MRPWAEILLADWPGNAEGWASHIWQSTVAGLAVLWLLSGCQRLSAGTRRTIAWVGLAKFAIPASGLLALAGALPFLPGHWAINRVPVFSVPLPEVVAPSGSAPGTSQGASPIGAYVAAVWLAVSLLFFLTWIVRGIQFRLRILKTALPLSPRTQASSARAALRAGLKRCPRCATTTESQGPGILGVLEPVVVIPTGLEETMGADEFESILIHEFIHVRRRDPFLGVVQALILSFFWFDPVAWLLSRRISVETEKSCDERVLRITGNPGAYVDGIMKALHHSLGLPQPAFAEAAAMPVVSRINGILSQGSRLSRPLVRNSAIAAACLVVGLSGYAGFFAAAPASAAAQRDKSPPDGLPAIPAQIAETARSGAFPVNLVSEPPGGEVFDASEVDQAPAVLLRLPPRYPTALLGAPVDGEVVVDLVVDSAGDPRNVRAAASSSREFEPAAVESVSTWRFTPAMKGGRRVNVRIQVTVAFAPPPHPSPLRPSAPNP